MGRSVLWNLLSSPFGGTVFPVNSKRPNVLGIKAYPNVRDLPDKVDLVVVTTPADTVPGVIGESVDWASRRDHHLRRFQGIWRARQGTGAADFASIIRGKMRRDRPELPGRDESRPAD